ncbi:ferredoxin [Candidatus Micrarchaeota archaeon]|nr:ferredoxin [Candidatus Micrarchaeota archaeon]
MGKKYLIQYDRNNCIGAGTCVAADPDNWSMNDDGKADLTNAQTNAATGFLEREIDENELEKMKEAAQGCPVNVIHIIDKESGQKII